MGNIASLGGTLPLLNQAISGVQSLDTKLNGDRTARNRATLDQTQLAERNRLEEQIATQKADRDKKILQTQQDSETYKRNQSLKRALARQRALYGASGLDDGSDTGSGEAVLSGLLSESDQESSSSDNIYTLRQRIIDENLDQMRAKNLLAERQLSARYKKLSGGIL